MKLDLKDTLGYSTTQLLLYNFVLCAFLDHKTLLTVSHTLVTSHIYYCNVLYVEEQLEATTGAEYGSAMSNEPWFKTSTNFFQATWEITKGQSATLIYYAIIFINLILAMIWNAFSFLFTIQVHS